MSGKAADICPIEGCGHEIRNSEFKRHNDIYHYKCPHCPWQGRRRERRGHNREVHPDLPQDALATTTSSVRPCPVQNCGRMVKGSAWTRHNRRYHFQCDQCKWVGSQAEWITDHYPRRHRVACHLVESIEEVLVRCKIDESHVPWPLQLLNGLSNYRLSTDVQLADYHADRSTLPLYVFSDPVFHSLPPLEEVAFNFLAFLGQRRNAKQNRDTPGQMWRGDEALPVNCSEMSLWIQSLYRRDPEASDRRVINIPHASLFNGGEAERTAAHTASFMEKFLGAVQMHCGPGEGNITPPLTITEIHHDSHPHISTAKGWRGNKTPLKLWLFWPASETHKLAGHYGDTGWALQHLPGAEFLVQQEGESVLVPANMPHAVWTLDACYLYGDLFTSEVAHWNLTTMQVEIASGCSFGDAAARYLGGLENRLADERSDLIAVAETFLQHWPRDAPHFAEDVAARDAIVGLWTACMSKRRSCAMCEALDMPSRRSLDVEDHIRRHLENGLKV